MTADDTHTDDVDDDPRPLLNHEERNGGEYDQAYRNELRRRARARALSRSPWPTS